MTRRFDPEQSRVFLTSELGFKDFESREMDEFRVNGNIGHFASARVRAAIKGILVGLEDRAFRLARQTRDWFTESIRIDERGPFTGGRAGIRMDAAVCDWLLGEDATALFEDAARHSPKADGVERLDKVDLDFTMPLWIQAGRFDDASALYEAFDPEAQAMTLAKARTPRKVGFVIARSRLGDERFSNPDVEKACHRLLARSVPEWAGRGLWSDLASWLKIVHWDLADRRLTPRDVILKAYDYLPGLSPP